MKKQQQTYREQTSGDQGVVGVDEEYKLLGISYKDRWYSTGNGVSILPSL